MKKLILIALLLVGVAEARVVTKTTTSQATGEGEGITRSEAINNALIEAIGKLSGVRLDSQKLSAVSISKSTSKGKEVMRGYAQQVKKYTRGKADRYNVDSVSESGGKYHAIVTIYNSRTTKRYKAPGLNPNNRRSIVVLNTCAGDYTKLGSLLQRDLVNALTKARKFNVLDRRNEAAYEMEKSLIKSGNADNDEVYKLGRVLGTDYFLIFSVQGLDASSKRSNLTGKTSLKAQISVAYRVILFATRQIKLSNTLNTTVDFKDGSLMATTAGFAKVANHIVNDVLGAIYPLKVSAINSKQLVFTQSLEKGAVYQCFKLGKKLKDAYTKESVGREETPVGKAVIVRVSPKMSYAKVSEGEVKKGDLCRLESSQTFNDSEGRGPDYKVDEKGGVSLGF